VLITTVVFALDVTIILGGRFILLTRDQEDRQSAHLVVLIWQSVIPTVLSTIAVSTLLLITTVISQPLPCGHLDIPSALTVFDISRIC
jgi:hypothetical protein